MGTKVQTSAGCVIAVLLVLGCLSNSAQAQFMDFPPDPVRPGIPGAGCCGDNALMGPTRVKSHPPLLPPRPWLPWRRWHLGCGCQPQFPMAHSGMSPEFWGAPQAFGECCQPVVLNECCDGSGTFPAADGFVPQGPIDPYTMPVPNGVPMPPGGTGPIRAMPMKPAEPTPLSPAPAADDWRGVPSRNAPESIDLPGDTVPPPQDAKSPPVIVPMSGLFRPVPGAARAWYAKSETSQRN